MGDQQPENCHQCGKCSSTCPVARFLEFRPRKIVAMVQLGMVEDLLSSKVIWDCAECLACKERCPREVAPYDIIQALQNLAFKMNSPFHEDYSTLMQSILEYGSVQTPRRIRMGKYSPVKGAVRESKFIDRHSLNLPTYKKPANLDKFADALRKALKGEN